MPVFEYRMVNPGTGRPNKRKRHAYDRDHLRELLAAEGITPSEIAEVPERPATEAQLQLLARSNVAVSSDLTIGEASDLISNVIDQRTVAEPRDFALARTLRVEVTRFASKATIYKAILNSMQGRDAAELGAWYAYRVYRAAFDRRQTGIDNPLHGVFRDIGRRIAADARLNESLQRAARRSMVHFRWFGPLRTPDGAQLHGDGDQSEVYRFTVQALDVAGLLPSNRGSSRHLIRAMPPEPSTEPPRNAAVGLRSLAVGLVLIVLLALWLL